MSWTTTDIPGLRNRTAVVTGANGGLGYETAHALAGAGATVVSAVRDQRKAALAQLRAATDPAAKGGEIYAPRFVNNGAPIRRPVLRRLGLDDAIDTLWHVSERETGESLVIGSGASGPAAAQ